MHVIGTIKAGLDFDVKSAYLRWRVMTGADWTLLDGANHGHTQVSEVDAVSAPNSCGCSGQGGHA